MLGKLTPRQRQLRLAAILALSLVAMGGIAQQFDRAPTSSPHLAPLDLPAAGQSLPSIATAVPLTPPATPIAANVAVSRGYLTTPDELARVALAARSGSVPERAAMTAQLEYASETRAAKRLRVPAMINVGAGGIESPDYLYFGSKYVYAWAIAYHLLRESDPAQAENYAERARELITAMPKRNTQVKDYEQNTRLNISVYMQNFVYAADLLAAWPLPGTEIPFGASDEAQQFKTWLGAVIIRYPYNAAHTRVNNWGAWGRLTMAVIADYVGDAAPLYVQQFVRDERGEFTASLDVPCDAGAVTTCLRLDAGAIYDSALQLHLAMVDGQSYEFSASSCDANGSKSMIRPDGGLPDELRREYDCDTATIPDRYGPAARYSQFALEAMVSLAELSWRRGTTDLYGHVDAATGRGAIFRAIAFLIDNDVRMTRSSMLEMANRYYSYQLTIEQNSAVRDEYQHLVDRDLPGILKQQEAWPAGVGFVSFGTLTHGFTPGDAPGPPPSTPPRPSVGAAPR